MPPLRLGLIGAGDRGLSLIEEAYAVRDRDYLVPQHEDWNIAGEEAYRAHARELPAWIEDVSALRPAVTAVVDPDRAARTAAARLCREHGDGPDLYDSLDAFLDGADPDAVVLASPNDEHVDAVRALLDRDVDVLCEKPLATTLDGHDRVIDAADRTDALFYVGFNLRSHPVYARLADLVRDGRIGDLRMITAHNVRVPFPAGYRYSQARTGGTLLEKNCHDFDLFRWYTGADPVRVAAFGGQHVLARDTDVVDHATVIVEYDDATKATLELCLYAPFTHRRHRSYFLRGTDGIVRTPDEPGTIEVFTRTERDRYAVGIEGGEEAGHGGADRREMADFLRCVRGEAEPPATPRDAKAAAAVAIAAERAIADGRQYGIDSRYDLQRQR